MTNTYPRSGITHMADGTDITWNIPGPGEYSFMIFSPKAKELLKGVEIKGVGFKDSRTRRNK